MNNLCRHCSRVRPPGHIRRSGLCVWCDAQPRIRNLYTGPPGPIPTLKPGERRCLECQRATRQPTRGLCQRCYKIPAIRARYPTVGPRGRLVGNTTPPPAPQPTTALPGTEAKIRVLEARAAAGLQLFHPADARHVD